MLIPVLLHTIFGMLGRMGSFIVDHWKLAPMEETLEDHYPPIHANQVGNLD